MKFLLFCVLAGLSLAEEETGIVCKEAIEPKGVDECLIFALYHIDGFLKNVTKLLCEYKDGAKAVDNNTGTICIEFLKTLVCAACPVDKMFGAGKPVENLMKDHKEACKAGGSTIEKTVEALGIANSTAKLLCNLTGGALAGNCMTKLLQGDLKELITEVKDLLCEDIDKLTGKEIIEIFVNIKCIADDVLHIDDPLLGKILTEFSEEIKGAAKDLVKLVKGAALEQGLVAKLACPPLDGGASGLVSGLTSTIGGSVV